MSETPLRIAVTGASGYIAGRLISRLQESDRVQTILATDIRPPPAPYSRKVKFVHWDVTEPRPDIFAAHEINAVVHLAYILNPGRSPAHARRVNVTGTDNVLQACETSEVRHILYLSSASVYGAHPDNPPFLIETDPVRPIEGFQYSQDKAAAESRLAAFDDRNPSTAVTILRVCPVMGPNADNFIARAFRKPILPAIGRADPPMQFLHEDDLIRALTLCLERRPQGIYNLAPDDTIRWSEMAAMINRPLISLPAPVWRSLTAAAWRLRLQNDSPACGLHFIHHRWTVSPKKIKSTLTLRLRHTSRSACQSYADAASD